MIKKSIEENGNEYEVEGMKISSLFFADDSLGIAKNEKDARENLKIIIETSRKFGLEVNKEKSNILIYNKEEEITRIEEIEVVKKIKYLGLEIDDDRDMFKSQRKIIIDKIKRYKPLTNQVIETSCNRLLIGKTFWKQVVMTGALHGVGLINLAKTEMDELQVAENEVYRIILKARRNVAMAAVRGDIGSSLVESRFIQTRIMLVKGMIESKNEMIKEILKRVRSDGRNPWKKKLDNYLKEINIKYDDIEKMSKMQIKKK